MRAELDQNELASILLDKSLYCKILQGNHFCATIMQDNLQVSAIDLQLFYTGPVLILTWRSTTVIASQISEAFVNSYIPLFLC